jgi:hypothetical protein
MNFTDDVERSIEKLHISTKTETDERILEDAYAALESITKEGSGQREKNIWQTLLTNRIVQYAAVAALIIVISVMFFKSLAPEPTASMRIDTALKKADNVCISNFRADDTEPYEQVWFSQTMEIQLIRTTENNRIRFALTDIPSKVRMLTYSSSDVIQREAVTENVLAELEKSMIQNSGLVTFLNSNEFTEDLHWQRVIDPTAMAQVPGTKIYDVTLLQEAAPGEAKYRKWRILADAVTYLPQRAEWYAKSEFGREYELEKYAIFSYPAEKEIRLLIQNTFGPVDRQPDVPGYIGTPGRN